MVLLSQTVYDMPGGSDSEHHVKLMMMQMLATLYQDVYIHILKSARQLGQTPQCAGDQRHLELDAN